jgi:hypothetical protein
LILGLAILAGFAAVIVFLAPVYIDNYRLGRYVHDLSSSTGASAESDDQLRNDVVQRAHQLDLPVVPADIRVDVQNGKRRLEARYKVQMDLVIYPVDLHMAASSGGFPANAALQTQP